MSLGKKTFLLKMVLAGDGAVGKTSLRERYLGRGFKSQYLQTIGADFALKEIEIKSNNVKFQIWDLAGQQRFQNVRSVYYTGALAALLLFDITRRDSFNNLDSWIKEIWEHNGKGIIPIVVLGNKFDLRDESPDCVDKKEALKFCKQLSKKTKEKNFQVDYLNTSAKTGLNVDKAFQTLGDVYFEMVSNL
ncbi:MAG: Rab family GTPase [Candidatus Hodarchaeales archaeon]|jgi:small GTP-binding protein